jgi:HEAT repeat protein
MNGRAEEEKRYRSVLELDLRGSLAVEVLVEMLYDESWRIRGAAAERLANLPDRHRAVPGLLAALADRGHAGARNSAAEALVRLGVAAAPAVMSLMGHPDPDQRRFAADILGGMRLRAGTPVLVAALKDADHNVRISAAEALGRIGGDSAANALHGLLDADDALLRLCALEGLAELKRPPALERLAPLLADTKTRRTAYRLLGLIPDLMATDFICEGLASGPRSVAEAALAALEAQRFLLDAHHLELMKTRVRDALGRITSARDLLENALSAGEREARAGALFAAAVLQDAALAPSMAEVARDKQFAADVVRALCSLGPAAAAHLLSRIDSLSAPARLAAAESLVQLAGSPHVSRLAQLAEGAETDIQFVAIKALGHSGVVEAVEPLARLLAEDRFAAAAAQALVYLAQRCEEQVFQALERSTAFRPTASAIWALARVGKVSALSTLRRTVRHVDPRVRAASVEGAGDIGREAMMELAEVGLADADPVVRCAAARGLAALAAELCEPLLRRALADPDAWVQAAAIEAAGENASIRLSPQLAQLASSVDGLRASRAVRALARMKGLSAELWQRAIAHRDPEVIKEALFAAPAGPECVVAAVKLLAHERWDVRAAAARVLSASDRPDLQPLLSAALECETDAFAREALAEACNALATH